ncbi:MAG: Yip1 family protein [Candidatus Methanoperedens sp.]|nr:Yip1 family protein [Candidatus Methanoperedens sp.]
MNFVEKIKATLLNPKNAMKSIAERPMIEEAVLILGIYAILGALAAFIRMNKVTIGYEGFENMPSSIEAMTTIISMVGIVFSIVSIFILWLAGTGIIHIISLALGGEGKFSPQMLTIAGYSFIPMIFASIITLALLFMMEPMTITISKANPVTMDNNPYMLATGIIATLMQAWASVILFFGIQSAHRLTPVKSAIVAGIPFVISVLSLAWNLMISGIL